MKAKYDPLGTMLFKHELRKSQSLIDDDIEAYARATKHTTLSQYGSYARLTADTFLGILSRGGKRIRGILVCVGYQMAGGRDQRMILQVARAIEMLHAYILIIDDIQDRSLIRRGGPSAHSLLAQYHKKHSLAGDAEHFGIALALNSALGGAHAAQTILANLPADDEDRLKVLSIVNRTMLVTAHGQTQDIMHEFTNIADEKSVYQVLEHKTAQYSFLNPLHVGMVLAGADCEATDAITPFALHTGRAFQIVDDIRGTFGTLKQNGKSPMDDIREGKRTILTTYALNNASLSDKKFLVQNLGNQRLTKSSFEKCKTILRTSGALKYAQDLAEQESAAAAIALDKQAWRWEPSEVTFLKTLAGYIAEQGK